MSEYDPGNLIWSVTSHIINPYVFSEAMYPGTVPVSKIAYASRYSVVYIRIEVYLCSTRGQALHMTTQGKVQSCSVQLNNGQQQDIAKPLLNDF